MKNQEIKDIIKVVKSLESREILLLLILFLLGKLLFKIEDFSFFKPLVTTGLPLMKTVLSPLTKSVLIPLGLTALIISNVEIEDIMKTVTSLEKLGLLIKGIRETIKNEAKEQKGEFVGILL